MINSSICDKSSFLEPLPTNEVIVMEDRVTTQEAIKEILEREFNLQVKIVDSKEEAIGIAEKNQEIQCYLLDVHMGNDRQQEGIDALEVIKELNKKSFVVVLTGHPSQEIQRMASRLGADLYREKSLDLENDIRAIGLQIKKRYRDLLQEQLQTIDRLREDIIDQLEKINKLDKVYDSSSTSLLFKDVNINAYEKLKLNKEWFATYQDKYVVFIDGKLIASNEQEQKLLKQLKSIKYQDQPIFFTKVEENPRIIDLPPSLWFDSF